MSCHLHCIQATKFKYSPGINAKTYTIKQSMDRCIQY